MISSTVTHVFNYDETIQVENRNSLKMTESVQTFLGDLGLLQYYDMFVIKGFDSEEDLCYVDGKDLDAMYITDPDHRKQILGAGEWFGSIQDMSRIRMCMSNCLAFEQFVYIE